MFKNLIIVILVSLLFTTSPALAADKSQLSPKEIRQKIEQIGLLSKVRVKLTSGEKLKGTISAIKEDSVALQIKRGKIAEAREVQFIEIAEVKKGHGLSNAAIAGIVIGTGLGIIGLIVLAVAASD